MFSRWIGRIVAAALSLSVDAMSDAIFFYGTLRPALVAGPMRPIVQGMIRLGEATLPGLLFDLGPYPAAILDTNEGTILGEVFVLPDDPSVLASLDEHEEYHAGSPASNLYVRVRRMATLADGTGVDVWVYAYNRSIDGALRVPQGDYVAWRSRPSHR